ncbi:MAG: S1 RNA-binding domain-containing protein [Nitrospiria bacterium]
MIKIGKWNRLPIVKEVDFGIYLDGGVLGEILLPDRYAPDLCEAGDMLNVFIYADSEDRLIATTQSPYAVVGDCACLKVVSVHADIGAFLDWGLPKDLLVPFKEQNLRMKAGERHIVCLYVDDSRRIVASAKLDRFLTQKPNPYRLGQAVDLLICNETDMGYRAIINNTSWGMLYFDGVFTQLKKGQRTKGYIQKVRPDHKIDLCLQKPGYEKVEGTAKMILRILKSEGGFIALTDKSPPEVIAKKFNVSKKTYKKALGALYKKRWITIETTGIRLNRRTSS